MFRTILCLSFLVSQFGLIMSNNDNDTRTYTVDVSGRCPDVLHRVDYVDEFWVKGLKEDNNNMSGAWWGRSKRCRVTFETTQDQGLCVNMKSIDIFAEGVSLEFLTNVYRPHKHYGKGVSTISHWCTHKNQVTMVVRLPRRGHPPPSAFDFTFEITNKSQDSIEKVYNMGSAADCDMHYILKAKEAATIKSHVTPHWRNDPIPTECEMTFTSLSEEEYGQVCVSIEKFDNLPECDMELEMIGMDTDYWDEKTDKFTCKTQKNYTREVCSGDKVLTLKLKRGKHIKSASFVLKVASKWMSYWESAEKMKTELNFLAAAKSLTVLIATLDTIVVLTAAFISVASRYPYGRLKIIGELFGKDPTAPHHYANEYPVAVAVTSGESDPPPF